MIPASISEQSSIRQLLLLAQMAARDRYKVFTVTKAISIFDFNRNKEREWEDHLVSTIHPEYLGDLWGPDRERWLKLLREIVVIANLETALADDPGNANTLLNIVKIGRTAGVHVIAAVNDVDALPTELIEHFSVTQ